MPVTLLYTTGEAVRAAIGVNAIEVSDTFLTDSEVSLELSSDLYEWLPTHAAIHAAGIAGGATAAEVFAKDTLVSYCKWFCAWRIVEKPFLFYSVMSNGKDKIERFKDMDLKLVRESALGQRNKYKNTLTASVLGAPTSFIYGLIGAATPDADPVVTAMP